MSGTREVVDAADRAGGRGVWAGIDVGGTFTDLLVYDGDAGRFRVGKTLTTPDDPGRAAVAGLTATLTEASLDLGALTGIVHGTTLVTNAIIERKGAKTALLTTRGFRDAVAIGREHRYDLYDLLLEPPTPLVERRLRFEVDERILADGTVRQPLDTAPLPAIAAELRQNGIEAVAIVLLNSFANPAHERRLAAVLAELAPELTISTSADVMPEIREYERTSTTIANAYVRPVMAAYLSKLERSLVEAGFDGTLLIMLSSGGICTVETAVDHPVRLIESGPAAGALAAAEYGRLAGQPDLLSFDMGGTTAKICLIDEGQPARTTDFEVARVYRFKKGSGLPLKVPVIEMIEIGAGGGSIARIDSLGLLKVGPDSAGAVPGPVCYGRGGTLPTVTDADLVLGYLDPAYFLGGKMALDVEAARAAIARQVGDPLGIDPLVAAWGIHQVVNENMANAARIHAVERGQDPRAYPVFAFGGAGPVHAYRVARALHAPRLIVPLGAGVTSAVGFLTAPLAFDFVRSYYGRLDELDWTHVEELFAEMEEEGRLLLRRAGLGDDELNVTFSAEMRYVGQGHEVPIAMPGREVSRLPAARIGALFEDAYRRLYGRTAPDNAIEALTWRVLVSGPRPRLPLAQLAAGNEVSDDPRDAIKGERAIYVPEEGALVDVPVYDRYRLAPGATFSGPAVVEERESTLVLGPVGEATVDANFSVVVEF